jgi:Leucine-rich repeat (LRR) protein
VDTQVEAGYNAVTKAIDFAAAPPEFSSDGDESIGSSLRYLDLQYNMVDQLEERMGRHPLLTFLNLSHNNLTGNLNALRPLQMLRNLDVSFNALTSDWGLAGLPIETLSLEENQVEI